MIPYSDLHFLLFLLPYVYEPCRLLTLPTQHIPPLLLLMLELTHMHLLPIHALL